MNFIEAQNEKNLERSSQWRLIRLHHHTRTTTREVAVLVALIATDTLIIKATENSHGVYDSPKAHGRNDVPLYNGRHYRRGSELWYAEYIPVYIALSDWQK